MTGRIRSACFGVKRNAKYETAEKVAFSHFFGSLNHQWYFEIRKKRIAPCGRQLLILLAELFLIQHWIADKPAALKVFPVHIYSGYLMVCVGGIVIDTSGGITA